MCCPPPTQFTFWSPDLLNAIAALFSAGAAVTGLFIAWWALRVSRQAIETSKQVAKDQKLSVSATLITAFTQEYESVEMRQRRKAFAEQLLNTKDRKNIDLGNNQSILDFFEEIAYLTKTGILDTGMVWNHFLWNIERYYAAVTRPDDLIEKVRLKYKMPELYEQLDWLYKELSNFREKENHRPYKPPNDEDVKEFLQFETKLTINSTGHPPPPHRD